MDKIKRYTAAIMHGNKMMDFGDTIVCKSTDVSDLEEKLEEAVAMLEACQEEFRKHGWNHNDVETFIYEIKK